MLKDSWFKEGPRFFQLTHWNRKNSHAEYLYGGKFRLCTCMKTPSIFSTDGKKPRMLHGGSLRKGRKSWKRMKDYYKSTKHWDRNRSLRANKFLIPC